MKRSSYKKGKVIKKKTFSWLKLFVSCVCMWAVVVHFQFQHDKSPFVIFISCSHFIDHQFIDYTVKQNGTASLKMEHYTRFHIVKQLFDKANDKMKLLCYIVWEQEKNYITPWTIAIESLNNIEFKKYNHKNWISMQFH